MQISTFAAIEIGSYSVNMEIFELSRKYGIRSIDQVRHRMELGKDSYGTGRIGKKLVRELCLAEGFLRNHGGLPGEGLPGLRHQRP